MKRQHIYLIQAAILFFLLLAITVQSGLLLNRLEARLDVGGKAITSLDPSTISFLDGLQSHLAITYFVTPKDAMPAHLKGVEAPVRAFLKAFRQRAPHRVDIRVISPEVSGGPGGHYAALKKASPFSVRNILKDTHDEQKVWSSLVLSYADHPELLIQKITPHELPYLEDLILKSLHAQKNPIRPRFAVSAPPGFTRFVQFLKQYGHVQEIDLGKTPIIPPGTDLLFWLDPTRVTPANLGAFRRFVDTGHTAFLAGSAYGVDYRKTDAGAIEYIPYAYGKAWQTLLGPLGITPRPDLLMDKASGPIFFRARDGSVNQVEAPFHLRVMPGYYHLKEFMGPARGALNFASASPLDVDPRKVAGARFGVELLGSSTENAWVQALPGAPFSDSDLSPGLKVGKQNLMLRLDPEDPWRGQIVVLGTSSLFRDGIINQPNYAHRVFLQTVLRTLTETQRLVKGRVERSVSPPIPPLKSSSRIFWRGFAVFLAPLIFLLLAARRYLRAGGRWPAFSFPLKSGLACLLILLASAAGTTRWGPFLDFTQNRANTPIATTRALLTRPDLQADLFLPTRAALPVQMKHLEPALTSTLKNLGIPFQIRRPETLSLQVQARLKTLGMSPFEVRTVRDDAEVSTPTWSGLVLRQADRATAIPRLDHRTLDHLEFLLVSGARRLQTGGAPHIGLIAEPPRLSPAEAFEYHQKGLSPPKGADVFSEVKTLLHNYGYRITYINPRSPHLPDNLDLLVWFQPRRNAGPTIQLFSQHLAGGGKAIVALQHFNIQQRQYRGSGFQTVYWPQPQYQDLNQYLIPLGIEQIREVLMDQTRSRLQLETQINRRAVREYEAQEVTQPFLIRVVGPNFSSQSPITRHLGDQLFIWGNRFAFNADSLNAHGLDPEILVSTSSRSWSYVWAGGWLPDSSFTAPTFLPGKQALAVLLRGIFPRAAYRAGHPPHLDLSPGSSRGSLMLIGSSEMFKNDYLYAPGFQHEQLLLNAVAHLVYGPEFAELQARRKIVRGFAAQPPFQTNLWRILTVGLSPLVFVLIGLSRWRKNRRISA